ncbi:hypothetical protein GBAR_LOCUS5011 [Geodia barretti]|uniref:Uncharacterized protein n=1 Tax=Geodia barretti TaxID=519541 RepID=A0AA35W3R9_GEOBA|nr:hypothetical protein GBAR_LOCUS5011 [Geodia barretti]
MWHTRRPMEKMQNVYKGDPKLGDPNSDCQRATIVCFEGVQGQQGGASPRPSPKNKKKNDKNGKSEPVPAQKAQAAPQPPPVSSPPDEGAESFSEPEEEEEGEEEDEEDGREGVVIYDFSLDVVDIHEPCGPEV